MEFPTGKYDIVLADPPWHYYGDAYKNAAAGKYYSLMTQTELARLPMQSIMAEKSVLFLWATGPRLDYAIDIIRSWGLYYRGITYVWVKTNKQGNIIKGQGIPPTFTKPTTELLLSATRQRKGRPFPILDFAQGQVILAPRGPHSRKPGIVREQIVELCGDRPRIELFATELVEGWANWGKSLSGLEDK